MAPQTTSLWRVFPPPCLHALLRFACSVAALRLGFTLTAALGLPAPASTEPGPLLRTAAGKLLLAAAPKVPIIPDADAAAGACEAGTGGEGAAAAAADAAGGIRGGGDGGGGGGGAALLVGVDSQLLLAAAAGGLAAWLMDLALTAATAARIRGRIRTARGGAEAAGGGGSGGSDTGGGAADGAASSPRGASVQLYGGGLRARGARPEAECSAAAAAAAAGYLPPTLAASQHTRAAPAAPGEFTASTVLCLPYKIRLPPPPASHVSSAAVDEAGAAPPSRRRRRCSRGAQTLLPPPPQQQQQPAAAAAPACDERPVGQPYRPHPASTPEFRQAPAQAGQSLAALPGFARFGPQTPDSLVGFMDFNWSGGASGGGGTGSSGGDDGSGPQQQQAASRRQSQQPMSRCSISAGAVLGASAALQQQSAGEVKDGAPGAAQVGEVKGRAPGAAQEPTAADAGVHADACLSDCRQQVAVSGCEEASAAAGAPVGAGPPSQSSPPLPPPLPRLHLDWERVDAQRQPAGAVTGPELRLEPQPWLLPSRLADVACGQQASPAPQQASPAPQQARQAPPGAEPWHALEVPPGRPAAGSPAAAAVAPAAVTSPRRPSVLYNSPVQHVTVMFKLDGPPDMPYERVVTSLTSAAHIAVDQVMNGGVRAQRHSDADAAAAVVPATAGHRRSPAGRWLGYTTHVHCLRGCVEVVLRLQYEGGTLRGEELARAVTGLEQELRQQAAVSGIYHIDDSGGGGGGLGAEWAPGGAPTSAAAGPRGSSSSSSLASPPPADSAEARYPIIVLQHLPPLAPPLAVEEAPGLPLAPTRPASISTAAAPPVQPQQQQQQQSSAAAPASAAPPVATAAATPTAVTAASCTVGGDGGLAGQQPLLASARVFTAALPLVAYVHPPVLAATVPAAFPFLTASDDGRVLPGIAGVAALGAAGIEPAAAMGWFGGGETSRSAVHSQAAGGDHTAVGGPAIGVGVGGNDVGGFSVAAAPSVGRLPPVMEPWSSADCSGYFPPPSSRGVSGDGGGRGEGGDVCSPSSGEASSGAVTDSNRSSEPGMPGATSGAAVPIVHVRGQGRGLSHHHGHHHGHRGFITGPPLLAIPDLELSSSTGLHSRTASGTAVDPSGAEVMRAAGSTMPLPLEPAASEEARPAGFVSRLHRPRLGPGRGCGGGEDALAADSGGAAGSAAGRREPLRRRNTFDSYSFSARGGGGSDGDSGGRVRGCPPRGAPASWDRRLPAVGGGDVAAGTNVTGGAAGSSHGGGGTFSHPAALGGAAGAPAAAVARQPPEAALGSRFVQPAGAQEGQGGPEAGGEAWKRLSALWGSPPRHRRRSVRIRRVSAPPGALDLVAPLGSYGHGGDHPPAAPASPVLPTQQQQQQQQQPQHPEHRAHSAHHQHQHHHHIHHRHHEGGQTGLDPVEGTPLPLPTPSPPPAGWVSHRSPEPPAEPPSSSPHQPWALRPPEAGPELVIEGVAESGTSLLPPSLGSFASGRSRTAAGGGGVRVDLFFDTDHPMVGLGRDGGPSDSSGGGSGSSRDAVFAAHEFQMPPPAPTSTPVDVRVVVKQHGSVVAEVERLTLGPRGASVRLDLSGLEEGSAALLVLPCRPQQPPTEKQSAALDPVEAAGAHMAALLYAPIAITPPLVASELRTLMREMHREAASGPQRADPRVVRARAFTHHFSALMSDMVSLLLGCERVAEEAEAVAAAAAAAVAAASHPAADAGRLDAALEQHQDELRELGIGLVSYLTDMGLMASVRYLLDEVQGAGVQIRSGDLAGEAAVRHILGIVPEEEDGRLEPLPTPPQPSPPPPPPHHHQQQPQQPEAALAAPTGAKGMLSGTNTQNGRLSGSDAGDVDGSGRSGARSGSAATAGVSDRHAAPGLRDVLLGFEQADLERRFEAFLGEEARWLECAVAMALPVVLPLALAVLVVVAGSNAMSSVLLSDGEAAKALTGGGCGGGGGGASCSGSDGCGSSYRQQQDGVGGGKGHVSPAGESLPVAVSAMVAALGLLLLPAALCKATSSSDGTSGTVMQRRREALARAVHLPAMALLAAYVWSVASPLTDPRAGAAYTVAALVVLLQPTLARVRFRSYRLCWALDLLTLVALAGRVVGVGVSASALLPSGRGGGMWDQLPGGGVAAGAAVATAAAGSAAAAVLLAAASALLAAWMDLGWRRSFLA